MLTPTVASEQLQNELPTLEAQGIDRLVSRLSIAETTTSSDIYEERALELRRLSKSLLLNYLELIGILSLNPKDVR